MKIKEIIDDIFNDIDTADRRHEDTLRDMGVLFPRYRARRDHVGLWSVLLPHIIGFVVGLAVTRLFGLHGYAYLIIGTVCAFLSGLFKSVAMDKISIIPALIRNGIILGAVVIIGIVTVAVSESESKS